MSIDTQRIQDAFVSKDKTKIAEALDALRTESLSEEQVGALIVHLTSVYLDISNKFDESYVNDLKAALVLLKKYNTLESDISDEQKLKDLKSSM